MKRSFFLALAAGLIASFALTAPTRASSTVLVDTSFAVTPSTGTASDVEVQTSATPSSSVITILPTTTVTGITTSVSASGLITIDFTATNHGEVDFTFQTNSPAPYTLTSASVTGVSGSATGTVTAHVAGAGVPEPASMALLGIGMTGLLAFRRFFKKTSVA